MAKRKRKHGCLIGCLVIFLLVAAVLAVAATGIFHAPDVASLEKRLGNNADLTYAIAKAQGDTLDTEALSAAAQQTYTDLQLCYHQYMTEQKTPSWAQQEEGEEAALPAVGAAPVATRFVEEEATEYRFACSTVVEFMAKDAEADDTYGLIIYTDSAATALEVFFAYSTVQSNGSENHMFLRGKAIVIGNMTGLKYIYLNSFI